MTGDGELGEGQIWEAAASAAKFGLDTLTAIVDRNHFQQTGAAEEVLNMDPIDGKFAAFGWHTQVINGNDMGRSSPPLTRARAVKGQPTCIVSLTHKGQGILPLLNRLGDTNSTASRSRPSIWTRPSPRSPRAEPGDHSNGRQPA
jgi:transketolase